MFLLGLLSLLQMAVLPGLLVTWGLRLTRDALRGALLVFCLSALINGVVVLGLFAVGLYGRVTVGVLFVLEMLALALLVRRRGGLAAVRRSLAASAAEVAAGFRVCSPWLVALAAIVIALTAADAITRFQTLFTAGDAVNSWNRWAIEIAAGDGPTRTRLYPQLVPAVLSISYVFMGSTAIWFFAKGWLSLFLPVLLLWFVDAAREPGRDRPRSAPLLAVPLTALLLLLLLRPETMFGGVVDVALATFALGAVVCAGGRTRRDTLVGAMLALACGLTKQGGLYVLVVYPLLAWVLTRRRDDRREPAWLFLAMLAALLLLAAPWYALMADERGAGHMANLVGSLHGGRDLGERAVHAGQLVAARLGIVGTVGLGVAVLGSLACRACRWITLLVTIPYVVVWVLGFSYDTRNLALATPFLALAAGCVVESLYAASRGFLADRSVWWGRAAVVLVAAIALLIVQSRTGGARLRKYQARVAMETIGSPALNDLLVGYFREHPEPGLVLSHYQTMRWIPEVAPRWNPFPLSRSHTVRRMAKEFRDLDVRYLLVDDRKLSSEQGAFVDLGVELGGLEREFRTERFSFYRVVYPPRAEPQGGWHGGAVDNLVNDLGPVPASTERPSVAGP